MSIHVLNQERYGSIISIAPVASYESDKLAVMAVTQRGILSFNLHLTLCFSVDEIHVKMMFMLMCLSGARLYFGNLRGVAWLQDEEAPRLSVCQLAFK